MALADMDLTSLRREELVALVRQLRQQLAEREQEMENLRRQLEERQETPPTEAIPQMPSSPALEEPDLGSQEDLLAQLEKIYPEGR
jgi:Tfp pilus assembly protein PilO